MVLYPNKMHVVTIDGTGIDKLSDLKGKRVSTGSPGSGTEIMALRVLEAVGIDGKKDIKQERLGAAESVNAIKDRKIDAFFWVGGVPTAAVTDLAATPGIKMKLIDHAEAVDAMNKKYGPLYVKSAIPAGSYPGQDKPNTDVDVWNILVVSDKMSDDMAYSIVKTLFEKKAELVAVHQEAKNIDLKNQPSARRSRSIRARASTSRSRASRSSSALPSSSSRGRVWPAPENGQVRPDQVEREKPVVTQPPRPEPPAPRDSVVSEDRLAKAAEFIEEEEGATSHFGGALAAVGRAPHRCGRQRHRSWRLPSVCASRSVAKARGMGG